MLKDVDAWVVWAAIIGGLGAVAALAAVLEIIIPAVRAWLQARHSGSGRQTK